jgi:hypothetical protein
MPTKDICAKLHGKSKKQVNARYTELNKGKAPEAGPSGGGKSHEKKAEGDQTETDKKEEKMESAEKDQKGTGKTKKGGRKNPEQKPVVIVAFDSGQSLSMQEASWRTMQTENTLLTSVARPCISTASMTFTKTRSGLR